jgi:hypothetical protein
MVIDRDFARWYDKALETCQNNNVADLGWLRNVEAAWEIHAEMVANDRDQQMQPEIARLRRDNAELHRANADLARRVARLEKVVGANDARGEDYVLSLLKIGKALVQRIEMLEQRQADAPAIDIDYDGERTLRIGAGNSAKYFILPIPLDRGAYRSGQFYSRGDVISYNGSAWIAQTAGILPKPPSDDWRLSVRAGRDRKETSR